jgi:hypothetical protein
MSKARAKFCPRKWDVPDCSAFLSPIIASIVYERTAPANLSRFDLRPGITGMAASDTAKSVYTSSIWIVSASASSAVACAVWPSCHKNSAVRRNSRVRSSQRTTLFQQLIRMGRSR